MSALPLTLGGFSIVCQNYNVHFFTFMLSDIKWIRYDFKSASESIKKSWKYSYLESWDDGPFAPKTSKRRMPLEVASGGALNWDTSHFDIVTTRPSNVHCRCWIEAQLIESFILVHSSCFGGHCIFFFRYLNYTMAQKALLPFDSVAAVLKTFHKKSAEKHHG